MNTDAYAACFWGAADDATVGAGAVTDFRVENADSDDTAEVLIDIEFGKTKKTKAYVAKCKELITESDKENGRDVDVTAVIGRKRFRLLFDFDGKVFKPDAASAAKMGDM